MKYIFDPRWYEISWPLFVRVDADSFEMVKTKLQDMSHNEREGLGEEAYFGQIRICIFPDEQSNFWKIERIFGRWTLKSDLPRIKKLIGDPEAVKIGNPPVSEEDALAEVAYTLEVKNKELRAMEETRRFYRNAIDDRDHLRDSGYHHPDTIMQAQLDMNRNKSLKEMSDKLNSIANSLSVIASKM